MKRVLVTEPIHEAGLSLLRARDDIKVIFANDADSDTLARILPGMHGIAVRTAKLPADLLALATELEVVSRHGVGCDNVDVAHLSARGIPVSITNGANSSSVAELTMAMALTLARRLPEVDKAVRENNFGARSRLLATDLEGATLLIVGFGRIGRKVASRARAFGMDLIVCDILPYRGVAAKMGYRFVADFRTELSNADFITLHVPYDDTTRHLISTAEFDAMKPGTVLINAARGGIVDEEAMLVALDSGPLSSAGLDVFSVEPPPQNDPVFNQLLARDDVILTPHTGAASHGAMRAMAIMAAQNILDSFDGVLSPENTFNLKALQSP